MLSRLTEKALGWVVLGLLVFLGIAIYQMPAETKSAIWSTIWRTVVWALFSATLPWSATLFMRRIVEAGTNWAGIGLIAGLTLVNVIAGLVLMTAWPSGGWGWAAVLGALAAAGTYNFLVAEYLGERQ